MSWEEMLANFDRNFEAMEEEDHGTSLKTSPLKN